VSKKNLGKFWGKTYKETWKRRDLVLYEPGDEMYAVKRRAGEDIKVKSERRERNNASGAQIEKEREWRQDDKETGTRGNTRVMRRQFGHWATRKGVPTRGGRLNTKK